MREQADVRYMYVQRSQLTQQRVIPLIPVAPTLRSDQPASPHRPVPPQRTSSVVDSSLATRSNVRSPSALR
jgi:hypothetical protein